MVFTDTVYSVWKDIKDGKKLQVSELTWIRSQWANYRCENALSQVSQGLFYPLQTPEFLLLVKQPVKMTHLPICCLRAFLFTRGPTPWPSFQPIFISSSTPMEDLRDKTNTPQSKFTLQTVKEGRMVLQKQAAGTQLVGCGCGSSYLAGAISSSSSVSPGIRAAWALMALAFSPASSLRLDENSWLVVISLGAMPCSLKSWQTPTTMCISSTKPEPQTSSRLFWNMFCIPERPSTQTLQRKSYKISFRWFPDIRQLLWQKRIKCYLIF